jgi:hypothetical protein
MQSSPEEPASSEKDYDVFISHASEDNEAIVFPLANLLRSVGVKVWYDEFELAVGDSLSKSINSGLARSKFGIVVISPAFLQKNWPEYELRGLTDKELNGEKVILPIWHNVAHADVQKYSPTLADKYALSTEGAATTLLVRSLVKVVRPDIHQKFLRALLIAAEEKKAIQMIPVDQIMPSSPRHPSLPEHYMARIITLHSVTESVLKMTLAETIYNFRCDLTPEREIRVWEHMCALYYVATKNRGFSRAKRKDVFSVFLYASMAPLGREHYGRFEHLSASEIDDLLLMADSKLSQMEFA